MGQNNIYRSDSIDIEYGRINSLGYDLRLEEYKNINPMYENLWVISYKGFDIQSLIKGELIDHHNIWERYIEICKSHQRELKINSIIDEDI